MAVDRFSSDGNAISDVLPVLWATPCFRIMQGIEQNQKCRMCFRLVLVVYDCLVFSNSGTYGSKYEA